MVNRFALFASFGDTSEKLTPPMDVGMQFSVPLISAGDFGFGSQTSWLRPPSNTHWMILLLASVRGFCMSAARMELPTLKTMGANAPRMRNSRLLSSEFLGTMEQSSLSFRGLSKEQ